MTQDDGLCTLREAITAANTDTVSGSSIGECTAGDGPDSILVPPGTYTLTQDGAREDNNATGDLDIFSDTRLIGVGSGSSIIEGTGNDRIFHIRGGDTEVAISQLTMTGGHAPDGTVPGAVGASGCHCQLDGTAYDYPERALQQFVGGGVPMAEAPLARGRQAGTAALFLMQPASSPYWMLRCATTVLGTAAVGAIYPIVKERAAETAAVGVRFSIKGRSPLIALSLLTMGVVMAVPLMATSAVAKAVMVVVFTTWVS